MSAQKKGRVAFFDCTCCEGCQVELTNLSDPVFVSLLSHLEFVDLGAHGYAKVRLSGDEMRTEFVCIPRPITRAERPDGGPLRYRVVQSAALWQPGERPVLRRHVIEGDPGLSI